MLAWERAPALPISRWFEPQLTLPPPDKLDDDVISTLLYDTIDRLFSPPHRAAGYRPLVGSPVVHIDLSRHSAELGKEGRSAWQPLCRGAASMTAMQTLGCVTTRPKKSVCNGWKPMKVRCLMQRIYRIPEDCLARSSLCVPTACRPCTCK